LNAVGDGLFYPCVRHEGRVGAHSGRFVRIDKSRVIEHPWMSEATGGVESIVTLTLEPKGADTFFTLRHSDLPDDEMGRRHEEARRDRGSLRFRKEVTSKVFAESGLAR
jgi:hypothetical protein